MRLDESNGGSPGPAGPAERAPRPDDPREPPHAVLSRRRWLWILVLAAAGVSAALLFQSRSAAEAERRKAAQAQAQKVVPVVAMPARKGDMGVYLTGLGTVTPVGTVTVRSRVDGQLLNVLFHEGQLVRRGDLLAEIDPRPFQVQLTQAEGQKAKDQAAYENAKVDLERYQALIAQDLISRMELDTQVATVAQFQAALTSDQGQIDAAKLNLTYSKVTAPISGRAGLRMVDAGNLVRATEGNGLVVLTQLTPITVLFTVPGDRLPQILGPLRAGRRLEVEAYDRDLKTKLATGSLLAVDNQIDPSTGTVRLKAQFANEDESLFPNQFVNARLLVDTLAGTVIVPSAAIQRSPQSTFVYVVKSDDTVEMRTVEVKLTEGDDAAVASGVSPDELVVTDGVDKLQAGMKVAVSKGKM